MDYFFRTGSLRSKKRRMTLLIVCWFRPRKLGDLGRCVATAVHVVHLNDFGLEFDGEGHGGKKNRAMKKSIEIVEKR